MSHSISGSTLLPTKAHEKTLFADMLRRRYRECGERLKNCTKWPTTIPAFSWKAPPLYQIVAQENKVAAVKHISGAQYNFAAEGRIPSDGFWVNPHSDADAFYKAGVQTLFMKDLFNFAELDADRRLATICHELKPDGDGTGSTAPAEANPKARAKPKVKFSAEMAPVKGTQNKRKTTKQADTNIAETGGKVVVRISGNHARASGPSA